MTWEDAKRMTDCILSDKPETYNEARQSIKKCITKIAPKELVNIVMHQSAGG